MGFLFTIRAWLADVRQLGDLYKLRRRNPGDIAAIATALKANELAMLKYNVGHAITEWAIMEERMIMVATLLLNTEADKAGLIFYSIINFNVWLSIIADLFRLTPNFTKFQPRWNKIAERLRAEKDTRDRLAHHYTMSASASPTGETISKAARMDTRTKSLKSAPMRSPQIEAFSDRIGTIGDEILKLFDDMLEHGRRSSPSRDTLAEPTPDQPSP
jgi:hypothetical protein